MHTSFSELFEIIIQATNFWFFLGVFLFIFGHLFFSSRKLNDSALLDFFWILVSGLSLFIGAFYFLMSFLKSENSFLDSHWIIFFTVPFCFFLFLMSSRIRTGEYLLKNREYFPFQNLIRQITLLVFVVNVVLYNYITNVYPASNIQGCFEKAYPEHFSLVDAYPFSPWILGLAYIVFLYIFRKSQKRILIIDVLWWSSLITIGFFSLYVFSLLYSFKGCQF